MQINHLLRPLPNLLWTLDNGHIPILSLSLSFLYRVPRGFAYISCHGFAWWILEQKEAYLPLGLYSFHCQGVFHLLPLILFQPFILTAVAELSNAFSHMQLQRIIWTQKEGRTRDHHPPPLFRPQQCWVRSHKRFLPQKQGLEKRRWAATNAQFAPFAHLCFFHRADTKSSVFREGTL
jgi:hypothetical protein